MDIDEILTDDFKAELTERIRTTAEQAINKALEETPPTEPTKKPANLYDAVIMLEKLKAQEGEQ